MAVSWDIIEKKWQERWRSDKDHETNIDDGREKRFITVAYPYPNSPQHIGHGRTYTIADIHARYLRMRGFNVLFPMGFHYTGTPILGMARRVAEGDAELLDILRGIYGVPEEVLSTFTEPIRIAEYFRREIREGMREIGYSIDWRREFTTVDPGYQMFVKWQIERLREQGRITQGSHPVGWCPRDENPVSQHDTLGDVEPSFTEYTLVKLRHGSDFIPAATLRPETIFGATNLWVNPDITYKRVSVDDEEWIVSEPCAYKLGFLGKDVEVIGDVSGNSLVGDTVVLPHDSREIPVLPAEFVEEGTGTGVVISVPAHAPFDYVALADIAEAGNDLAGGITPLPIISTAGYGEVPAREVSERSGIRDQSDSRLHDITKELYSAEFHGGVMRENCGRYSGESVRVARDSLARSLVEDGDADVFLELDEEVICRCGHKCTVKMLDNQWFLNYADESWKGIAGKCIEGMSVLPPEIRPEFARTLEWLRERACARRHGLGTRLPWDEDWIVESLSDSVIYMAYYTMARLINDGSIKPESLTRELLDYVLLGIGTESDAAASGGVGADIVRMLRSEFSYFYPVDSRHSGRDLVPNHLTFFVLNHVAVFGDDPGLWPRGIVVNGSVLGDGKKMSKSMGNIVPLRNAIREYGADPIRLAIIISAELLQDADFKTESPVVISGRLEQMLDECAALKKGSFDSGYQEERWLEGRILARISGITGSVDSMRMRGALQEILYGFDSDLEWYKKRAEARGRRDYLFRLYEVQKLRALLLSPFAPHAADEMWERLGGEGMASRSAWPSASEYSRDVRASESEEYVRRIIEDISSILRVTKKNAKRIFLYTAEPLKMTVYQKILDNIISGKTGMGDIMKSLIANEDTADIKKSPDTVQKIIKDILSDSPASREARREIGVLDEKALAASELGDIIRSEFGAEVAVYSEDDADIQDPAGKARHARPYKPAIFIE